MLLTTHILIGGAIGQAVGNAPLGFALGAVSHFALDAIPHFDPGIWSDITKESGENIWNKKIWAFVAVDLLATLGLLIALLPQSLSLPFIAGALGGASVDLVDNVPFWQRKIHQTRIGKQIGKFHNSLHFVKKEILRKNAMALLVVQVVIIGLIFWLIEL